MEIAFWLGKDYWGQGYMLEASIASLAHARSSFGIASVWAAVLPKNHRSIRVLEKIGMAYEKVFTTHRGIGDGEVTLLRYRMSLDQPS